MVAAAGQADLQPLPPPPIPPSHSLLATGESSAAESAVADPTTAEPTAADGAAAATLLPEGAARLLFINPWAKSSRRRLRRRVPGNSGQGGR